MKIQKSISIILFSISVLTTIFHLLIGVRLSPETLENITNMNLTVTSMYLIAVPSVIATIFLFFSSTYNTGCLMKSTSLFSLFLIFLMNGDYSAALSEIPFIVAPLLMMYFGYPFSRNVKLEDEHEMRIT